MKIVKNKDSIVQIIGKKMYSLRRSKGINQYQLANKLNITRQTLSKYENGERSIDIYLLIKICEILDISILELLPDNLIKKSNKLNNEINNTAGKINSLDLEFELEMFVRHFFLFHKLLPNQNQIQHIMKKLIKHLNKTLSKYIDKNTQRL